jgi:hypothetical protein
MFGGDLDALVLRQLEDRSFTWEESVDWSLPSMRMHAMTMALKAADVGHPVKPLALHLKWSAFVLEEFKLQNNIEEREGITPHFQISDEPVATIRSQIGFFKCVCGGGGGGAIVCWGGGWEEGGPDPRFGLTTTHTIV